MHSLDLLDIERQVRQLVPDKEVPDLVRIVQRILREHCDDRRLYGVLLQQFDATHRAIKGPPTRSINALSIMDMLWPVQAHTNPYLMMPDKVAPLLIDQRAIGLEAMNNAHTLRIALLSCTKSILIERYGQNERLARMPDDGDRIGKLRFAEKPFKGA